MSILIMRVNERIVLLTCLFVACFTACRKDPDPQPSASLSITGVSSTSSSAGDTLLITGTSFSFPPSTNTVLFNNTPATVISGTPSQLAIIVPQGVTTGNVSISVTAGSKTATYAYTFTRLARVSTYAGDASAGFLDAPLLLTKFSGPTSMTTDAAGNFYICDAGNNRIRKINASTGAVTTIAGNGVAGFADGPALSASFNVPNGIALDASGNIYVSDQVGQRIRKISNGVVSTLAGTGVAGFKDSIGSYAQFNYPFGIAVDASGNVFVADAGNHRIRKIAPNGDVTTFAGRSTSGFIDDVGTIAMFNYPVGLAIDAAGNLFVCDGNNNRIRRITPNAAVTTIAGFGLAGFADGMTTTARFNYPVCLTTDAAGNVYVSDQLNYRIRKITPAGNTTTVAGLESFGYINGSIAVAKFGSPTGITVDSGGNIYIADNSNNVIRKITP